MQQVSVQTSNIVPFADNTRARRLDNLTNAKLLAKSGLYIFVSSGKTPLVPRFNKIDTELTQDEREAAIEEYETKHGEPPIHVGATNDPAVVSKMFRRYPDAVPSIACGPSKLVVVDADSKDNGPALIGKHFEEHGLPDGTVIVPSQSGGKHYIFKDPDGKFTNAAGALKKQYGCDLRGVGGQYVAPGSMREDGKTYGTRKDLIAFLRAYTQATLPAMPDHIVELIGTAGEASQTVNDTDISHVIGELEDKDWPEYDELFDPTIGTYDLEAFKASSPEFAELYDNPTGDRSEDRWAIAQMLLQKFKMPVCDLAVFYQNWEGAGSLTDDGKGAGNYKLRDIAREWFKNEDRYASDGDVMGAAVDKDDEPLRKKRLGDQPTFSYIEDIRIAEPRFIEWAIKHFLARGTTSIVSGKWGTGKTAVYTDIALHIAHGLPYRDRKVTKGVVIYVALENAEDVERRIRAWCDEMGKQGHDLSDGAFVIHRGPCALYDQRGKATPDEKELIKIANKASEHYGLPVSMIVIDTLSQSITPGSDREDGSIFTGAMQRIVNATGANVSTLHHPTKAGEAVRGDSALQGNVDTVIDVAREGNGRGTIKAGSKFRIGDPAKVNFAYRLKAFEIDKDEDGDAITVVLAVEASVGVTMGAVDDTDDDSALTPTDTPADKLVATFRVFKERVESIAANTGEGVGEIGISAKMVFDALNIYRRSSGLPELKDRTIVSRLLGRLAEGGEIVKSGDNRRTEYKLKG
jgi:hypothetical protein